MVGLLRRFGRGVGTRRFILAAVIIVCALLVAFNQFRKIMIGQFFANMPVQSVTVSATKVEPTTWTPEIDAIGTLSAIQGVDVATEVAGVVKSINFTANDHIEAGQLLVQIDDAVERADLMSAEAAVARDQAQLARAERLRQTGVSSEATLEEAESNLAASQSALTKIGAVLDEKSIEAPFAGVIGIPRIDVGQYLEPGNMIATLQKLDTMRADFTVPEQQVGELTMDQLASFGLTETEFPYRGHIIGIDPKIDPTSRLVSVRAEVENPDGNLRPGQFVRVRVELPPVENVIALPQTAVVTSLYGDYVYLIEPAPASTTQPAAANAEQPAEGTAQPAEPQANTATGGGETLRETLPDDTQSAESPPAEGQNAEPPASAPAVTTQPEGEKLVAKQVFVEIGRRQGNLIEITKGLEPGQTVVTSGQNKLTNNAPVAVNNTVDPATLALEGEGGQPANGAAPP
jgi:membrane fusion protein (multidrug efflux system)